VQKVVNNLDLDVDLDTQTRLTAEANKWAAHDMIQDKKLQRDMQQALQKEEKKKKKKPAAPPARRVRRWTHTQCMMVEQMWLPDCLTSSPSYTST
jgi:hypothetical protein